MSDLVLFQPVRALDRNGSYAPGALARFYEPGTLTARTVYANAALSTAHPTPLVADASGVFPPVYTSGSIKAVITDADGVTLPKGVMDPAFVIAADNAEAGAVSFDATANIPEANVQDAIEQVDVNWRAALATIGLGLTGSAALLANLDATNTASGVWRFDATTTGTRPFGWASEDGGVLLILRQTAADALMIGAASDDGNIWARQMAASTWGAWFRVDVPAQDQATWNTGTGTEESTITPAKLAAAIGHRRRILHVVQQKATGVAGDNCVIATWAARPFTDIVYNTLGASISAGAAVLPAGIYRVTASDPAYNVGGHCIRLFNVGTSAVLGKGPSAFARSTGDAHATEARYDGVFVLAEDASVRLDHFTEGGGVSTFFGIEANDGSPEIYASAVFEWMGPA